MIFEVFARKARGEALRHIGNLNAPDAELARVFERWKRRGPSNRAYVEAIQEGRAFRRLLEAA